MSPTAPDEELQPAPKPVAPPLLTPSRPPPRPTAPPPAPAASLSLEESARLRAMLTLKGADKARLLEERRLDEQAWIKIEREHLRSIDEAAQAGDNTPLERYDDAFLAAQDEARGIAIDADAYAKIQVARERGQLATVLDELAVNRNDLLRLDRVWRRKLASDRSLAEHFEDEMERLRDEAF